MKLCNIKVEGAVHLALSTPRGVIDASAAGFAPDMDAVIAGADTVQLEKLAVDESLPAHCYGWRWEESRSMPTL